MEMILVLAVIGILVGLGIFAMKDVPRDAENGVTRANLKALMTNLIRYKTMSGAFPSQTQGLQAMVKKPVGNPVPKSWYQLMEPTALLDPWGHPFQYRNPGKRNPESYDVYSLGFDGIDGTDDDVWP